MGIPDHIVLAMQSGGCAFRHPVSKCWTCMSSGCSFQFLQTQACGSLLRIIASCSLEGGRMLFLPLILGVSFLVEEVPVILGVVVAV